MRVACAKEDRCLWWSESIEELASDHKMTVHLFVNADSPCVTAWALKRTATDHRPEFGNDVCLVVSKNLYVDDCNYRMSNQGITTANTVVTAREPSPDKICFQRERGIVCHYSRRKNCQES